MASRLTLFYGPSGVGKSSVLRAGVAHHLRRLARDNLDETGSPQLAVAVFNSWRDDPIVGLEARVRESALRSLNGETVEPVPPSRSLYDTFKLWTDRLGGELLIILDQFEEYFLYHTDEQGPDTFAAQFPRIVNSADLNVNFLLSMRDDGLAKLDHFQGQIPTLFDNRFGIDHLNRKAAREAITQPIEQFNRLYAAGRQRVTIEPDLVEAVLDQVKTGEVTVGHAGRGVIKAPTTEGQIETPYLQLVMNRLWDENVRAGSHTLRLKSLEALGGAQRIVRTHLDAAMKGLTNTEQKVAAQVFHYLVTPSGAKIAHTIPDLASYSELSRERLQPVMERLSSADIRILRGVAPPPEKSDEPRYEIFHDVLAAAILDWRQRYKEKKQSRRIRMAVSFLFALMIIALGTLVVVKVNENKLTKIARSQEEEIARAKERARLDELALLNKDRPLYEKPLAALVNLTSDDADDRSQALESLRQLASNDQLPDDLVPLVLETVKTHEPLKEEETRQHIEEAQKARVTILPPDTERRSVRVYIHIRNDMPQLRAKAIQVKGRLEEESINVPGIERVSNVPLNTELRYFRAGEADEVKRILGYLEELDIHNTQEKLVKGYENSAIIRPYHFELWFGAPKKEANQTPAQSTPDVASFLVRVIDEFTKPVEAAVVSVNSAEKTYKTTKQTNAAGEAAFFGVPFGRISVQVIAKGFLLRATSSITLTKGKNDYAKYQTEIRLRRPDNKAYPQQRKASEK
jgi:hypothetical protein